MSYEAYEVSTSSGEPVELYLFETSYRAWRYTSAETSIDYGGNTFEPVSISRSSLLSVREINKGTLTIEVPRDFVVASLFQVSPPGEIVAVTVFRGHRTDAAVEFLAVFVGRVLSCGWEGITAQLYAESASTSVKRPGLVRRYCAECPHALYGAQCGVDRDLYQLASTVVGITGTLLTVVGADAQADGYYAGGYLYWFNGDYGDYRFIEQHVGNLLTLMVPAVNLAAGNAISVYPGCARTLAVCDAKFSNSRRYGGWPFQPNVLPFNGNNIF